MSGRDHNMTRHMRPNIQCIKNIRRKPLICHDFIPSEHLPLIQYEAYKPRKGGVLEPGAVLRMGETKLGEQDNLGTPKKVSLRVCMQFPYEASTSYKGLHMWDRKLRN